MQYLCPNSLNKEKRLNEKAKIKNVKLL